ncbi:hypothetical protein HS088_TW05G00001 [Tripterygium wilfordii]|uniref:Uncharacterized protein n=1 Tax=Tripterygium wilfordii TaxID=458696 RepID=A0A7J7DLR8_TRIWF|nr:hypothetical protein HS088_TW05G00001 [Tripterygium wilfordii]
MFELLCVRTSQSNNTNTSSPLTLPQSQQPPSSSRFTSQSVNESQSTDEFGLALSNSTNARGTAKGIKEWGTGVQIKVYFDDKFQPVGKNAAALKGQLGQIDNLVDVPEGYKEEIAARNASSREMRGSTHTIGRTHFAQIRDRKEYEQRLSEYAESERTVAIRDQIFHELMGEDGHGYCQTYGSGIHRSAVYDRHKQSSSISTNDMISTEIARQVNEALEKMKVEFNKEVEEMRARIIFLESERGHHVDASGQAQDATSVRESVGDGSTPGS